MADVAGWSSGSEASPPINSSDSSLERELALPGLNDIVNDAEYDPRHDGILNAVLRDCFLQMVHIGIHREQSIATNIRNKMAKQP